MIKLAKGEMIMKDNYRLTRVINIFGIYPDFVYPIFEKDGKYYLQHSENNAIDNFIDISEKKRFNALPHLEIKPNINIKDTYTLGDRPIYAFQIDKDNIFISEINDFIKFVSNFQTDDHVLTEQISEFIDKVKLRKVISRKKERI